MARPLLTRPRASQETSAGLGSSCPSLPPAHAASVDVLDYDGDMACYAANQIARSGGQCFLRALIVVLTRGELAGVLKRIWQTTAAFGFDARMQDPSDQPARLEDQLSWLRTAGFTNVDCFWKWLELSLVGGTKPKAADVTLCRP